MNDEHRDECAGTGHSKHSEPALEANARVFHFFNRAPDVCNTMFLLYRAVADEGGGVSVELLNAISRACDSVRADWHSGGLDADHVAERLKRNAAHRVAQFAFVLSWDTFMGGIHDFLRGVEAFKRFKQSGIPQGTNRAFMFHDSDSFDASVADINKQWKRTLQVKTARRAFREMSLSTAEEAWLWEIIETNNNIRGNIIHNSGHVDYEYEPTTASHYSVKWIAGARLFSATSDEQESPLDLRRSPPVQTKPFPPGGAGGRRTFFELTPIELEGILGTIVLINQRIQTDIKQRGVGYAELIEWSKSG